jgi:hypothetical protein
MAKKNIFLLIKQEIIFFFLLYGTDYVHQANDDMELKKAYYGLGDSGKNYEYKKRNCT